MHRRLFVGIAACLGAAAAAQSGPAQPPAATPEAKIERIRIEDDGARIDELRVRGQTESITVQPKADVPPYEVPPDNLSRNRPQDQRDGSGKQRVWNVIKF